VEATEIGRLNRKIVDKIEKLGSVSIMLALKVNRFE